MADDYTVQLAVRWDLETILALRTAQGSRVRGSATQRELDTWEAMVETRGLAVYLALADEAPVGTLTSMMMPNFTYDCAPTVFIEAVSVLEAHRRRGVATLMLSRCLSDARGNGCDKVQLLSHKRHADDGAHRLYERLGFEAEAEGFRLYLRSSPPGHDLAPSPSPTSAG